jgi:hypothetical protein
MHLRTILAILAVAVAALGLAAAPAAAQDRKMLSEFQDDRVFTREGPDRLRTALDELKLLGVDMIRTVVNWNRLAPASLQKEVPQGFDFSDPASYSRHDWDPFDDLVREATARGIQIHMNPAGHTPEWASKCEVNLYRACLPDAQLFAQFVTAVARRYDGSYPDETDGQPLPRVSTWSLWNEPNINSWINPQTVGTGKKQRRTAAKLYRELFHAGHDALKATGHGADTVFLGETAPIGAPPKRTSPIQFYRDLFCIDARGRKLRGADAKKLGCTNARPFKVTGVAHHPYVKGAGPPLPAKLLEGAASVGTLDGLKKVLDQAARHRMLKRKMPIYITEFGISTNPPDTKYGVPLDKAAAHLNQADRYMWLDKRVRMVSQFEYEDDVALNPPTFQTGLRYGTNGQAKQEARHRLGLGAGREEPAPAGRDPEPPRDLRRVDRRPDSHHRRLRLPQRPRRQAQGLLAAGLDAPVRRARHEPRRARGPLRPRAVARLQPAGARRPGHARAGVRR